MEVAKPGITVQDLTFTYPGRKKPALSCINLSVKAGEFIVLCGSSGCGKTTLLRQMKPALAPWGKRTGTIYFHNMPISELDERDAAARIGFVMQNPENQIVTDKVWHELAFGLENLGLNKSSVRLRTAETASFFGIQSWFHKDVAELSGGQKQILTLASVTAMQPDLLILDEPTGQLDPIAASDFLGTVKKINRELGVTVILTEHRLEEALPPADRVVVMDGGKILCEGTAEEAGEKLRSMHHRMFAAMPVPVRVWAETETTMPPPITIREGREWLSRMTETNTPHAIPDDIVHTNTGKPLVELEEVWFKYGKELPDILKGLTWQAYPGELTAILGGNGTGKTTALSLIAGLNKPYRGKVKIQGKDIQKISSHQLYQGLLGVLPQNPQNIFASKTVREELEEMFSESRKIRKEKQQKINEIADLCQIGELMDFHPHDLSGGEAQRTALAKILLRNPRILLLDEPTKGLDAEFKMMFAGILKKLAKDGAAVIIVSHDIEFCAEYIDRCSFVFDGKVIASDSPRSFFSGNHFYTTAANRMSHNILHRVITAEDIVTALTGKKSLAGGKCNYNEQKRNQDGKQNYDEQEHIHNEREKRNPPADGESSLHIAASSHKPSVRVLIAAAIMLFLIPFTIWFGIFILEDRKYYFVSLLIMIETMLSFALVFENRRRGARELVLLAVLCAIGVAGRTAFFMLPQMKPMLAMVIIAGIAFGKEAGVLVGAVTAFVSNMFFGQGPWTPWQMFAFGLAGFLAGFLFQKGVLRRNRIAICIFGGLASVLAYGGIMNTAAVLMLQSNPNRMMLLAAYLQGIPFDLVHALSTIVFLAFAARPMLDKLDRVKEKYGFMEDTTYSSLNKNF